MEKNLDLECAKYGNKIVKSDKDETLITKSLGVLQEDGVYAFFLYLASRGDKEKELAKRISQETFSLLKEKIGKIKEEGEPLPAIREKLAPDLDSLLLAKQLLERTLVYARYHAKAITDTKPMVDSGVVQE